MSKQTSYSWHVPVQDQHSRESWTWRDAICVVSAPFGFLSLLAGVLLLVGGIIYWANGWRYGLAIAWWAGAWGLGASGLGTLLLRPFRIRSCIIGTGLSLGSAALFFLYFALITQADRSLLIYGSLAFIVAAVGATLAAFNHRRIRSPMHS
jgi:hypothetical protein